MICQSGLAWPGALSTGLPKLHTAVGVREATRLLEGRCRGQDHIGELGRFGEKDVLHDQKLEVAEPLAHLVGVGVTEERVLSQDVHPADTCLRSAASMISVVVRPASALEFHSPGLGESRTRFFRGDRLIVGVAHGNEAGI